MNTNILEQLTFPFHPSVIFWKPGSLNKERTKALAMAYATLRAYQDRLDEVCGLEWAVSYTPWGDRLICHLTIAGVTRSSTGEPDEQAERSEFAGTAAEAQAFKRACSMFTLGRYLYHLPTFWMDYDATSKQLTDQAKAKLSGIIAQHYTRALGEQNQKRNAEMNQQSDPEPDKSGGLQHADQGQTPPVTASVRLPFDYAQGGERSAEAHPRSAKVSDAPPQDTDQGQTTSENVSCALAMAALNAKGAVAFAKHWESAQNWLVERYTAKATPDLIRHSLVDLSSAELEALLAGLGTNTRYYVQEWHKQRKVVAKTNQPK